MKRMVSSVFGALLVFGLAGALSTPASAGGAGYGYGSYGGCDCYGPVDEVVNAGTRVYTTRRVINTYSAVPIVRVVNHTRVVLHRRTVIHREIVLHRHNTEYRYLTINRMNTAHRFQTIRRNVVINRYVNTRTQSHHVRTVQGTNCNCAPGQRGYRGMRYYHRHTMHSRD